MPLRFRLRPAPPRLRLILLLSAILAEIVIVAILLWRPHVEVPLDPARIVSPGGHEYAINLAPFVPAGYVLRGDTPAAPTQSQVVVLRDGVPLGPPHALHVTIRDVGNGAYTHLA